MVYINSTGKHNEVWLDKPYATITVECPDCPSTEDAYSSGYTDGSEEGYHKGYPSGYTDGYDSGYTDGVESVDCEDFYNSGYTSGYTDGADSVDCSDFYNSGVTDGIAEQKAKMIPLSVTQNDYFFRREDGYNKVEVHVPINLQSKYLDLTSEDFEDWGKEYRAKSGNSFAFEVSPDYGYTGLAGVSVTARVSVVPALNKGYNSGYTAGYDSGYTDGLKACSGGNGDLIANLQGNYFIIPEGTTKIRSHAFREACFSAITIPSSVRTIESFAFAENNCLEEIVIPSSVEVLDKYVFYYCRNLTAATFENSGLTSFGEGLFHDCDALIEVELPAALNNLPTGTFNDCRALSAITIPSGVTDIGYNCFRNCNSLSTITIPSAVTRIGRYCFYDDSGMSSMTFESTTPPQLLGYQYSNLSLGSSAYTWPIYVPCEAVDTYKTAWPYYAHRIECNPGNNSVLDLVYETSAANQTISLFNGEAANHNGFFYTFYSGITKMVIDGVEVAKSEENIHHSYPSSADWYFYTFPTAGRHNVKFYVDRSFSAHTDTGWMFPAYELRDQLFGAYSLILPEFPLVEAHIGEGYETIRGGVFQGNTNVTAVTLPSTMVSLYAYPFEYSGIHSIEIPDSVSAITTFQTSGTFNNCASLTSATFGTGITQIGNNTFSACTALTEITFNGVTPPTLLNANSLLTYGTDTFPIYVPASAVSTYQNEPSWADYASRVQAKP